MNSRIKAIQTTLYVITGKTSRSRPSHYYHTETEVTDEAGNAEDTGVIDSLHIPVDVTLHD